MVSPASEQRGAVLQVPAGLRGVVVTETSVGDVRGDEGFFHYRQYSAVELARQRSFEDAWELLFDGALPDSSGRFGAEVAELRELPPEVADALPAIATSASSPLCALRTALSLAAASRGLRPVLDLSPAERRADALWLSAITPTLVAALHRAGRGLTPLEPRDDLTHAANYLYMISGEAVPVEVARAVEQYLILTIDHGFNASTFTARVIASTGADVGACVAGALGALSGPLHGGAPSRALEALDAIGDVANAERWVTDQVASGGRIMGFGHAVYRTRDPRSELLREIALQLGGPRAELAERVESAVVRTLQTLKPGRALYANVEYYAGVVMERCGLPREMFTPTFATSRVVGWCAHVLEQAAETRIIRPSARYVGQKAPQPLP